MPQHNIRSATRSASDATAEGCAQRPSAPQAALANATSFAAARRAAPRCTGKTRLRGTSLLRHLATARVHLDQDPGHRFRVSTDRRHLMFQRVCRASTLRNQLIIGFQLALFWAIPHFGPLFRQSRLAIPHDGEGRRRTHRHSERNRLPSSVTPHSGITPGTWNNRVERPGRNVRPVSTSTAMTFTQFLHSSRLHLCAYAAMSFRSSRRTAWRYGDVVFVL